MVSGADSHTRPDGEPDLIPSLRICQAMRDVDPRFPASNHHDFLPSDFSKLVQVIDNGYFRFQRFGRVGQTGTKNHCIKTMDFGLLSLGKRQLPFTGGPFADRADFGIQPNVFGEPKPGCKLFQIISELAVLEKLRVPVAAFSPPALECIKDWETSELRRISCLLYTSDAAHE